MKRGVYVLCGLHTVPALHTLRRNAYSVTLSRLASFLTPIVSFLIIILIVIIILIPSSSADPIFCPRFS